MHQLKIDYTLDFDWDCLPEGAIYLDCYMDEWCYSVPQQQMETEHGDWILIDECKWPPLRTKKQQNKEIAYMKPGSLPPCTYCGVDGKPVKLWRCFPLHIIPMCFPCAKQLILDMTFGPKKGSK